MDQMKTGRFIADERRALGLTQTQLAEKLHISEKTVSRWETGKGMPEVSLMMPLCEQLGISVNELLSGERLSGDSREMAADRNLLSLLKEKAKRRKILGVVITAIVTLALMIGVYSAEYHVDASSTHSLESAINSYSFGPHSLHPGRETDVLESETAGRYLFALYRINGDDLGCGITELERGIFGRYRFIYSNQTDWPLYNAEIDARRGAKRFLLFGVNELPGVASFKMFSNSERTGEPIYEGTARPTPFLKIIETNTPISVAFSTWCRYYDADGNEIDEHDLLAEFTDAHEFSLGGAGSMELGLIYFYEALILFLGIVFIRYFLGKKQKKAKECWMAH